MGNEIRLGKVSAVDYAAAMVRVVYHEKDDSVTRWLPMLSDEYRMPEVGDQVLVLHLSNGAEAGVVLGRPWSGKNVPPESGRGLWRKDLTHTSGEAVLRYKDGVLSIRAAKIVLEGNVEVAGMLQASGDVTAGGISLQQHTHGESAGGNTSAPM